eukprot:CAMPEP_0174377214 /NCGR_PEP_ID=MMETSP0811_2-20130205/121255_1 /TAXON_ID=73025 ORGANISM="Eutreptiella gymnastica-like, Strain CCMP1594" /NCGR_SAMPLE_ID=MMETSP0811_2 /ASSEMBLY_ACC=CAM_ASM_000667 /LENGTH=114 /DNA_ID=CAMNT_0015529221 /DNA_START=702 /DNA_END=1042 /DNA_ORIENTATION=-
MVPPASSSTCFQIGRHQTPLVFSPPLPAPRLCFLLLSPTWKRFRGLVPLSFAFSPPPEGQLSASAGVKVRMPGASGTLCPCAGSSRFQPAPLIDLSAAVVLVVHLEVAVYVWAG